MPGTILIVDDDPRLLSAVERVLHRENYRVLTALTGRLALDILAQVEVDVVVSDQKMPGLAGTEFLALVRKQHPHVVRIMLTGEPSLEVAMRAINEGQIYRFFTKPCPASELSLAIREALEQRALAGKGRELLEAVEQRETQLKQLERENPGILRLDRDPDGAFVIDDSKVVDLQKLCDEMRVELERTETRLGTAKRRP